MYEQAGLGRAKGAAKQDGVRAGGSVIFQSTARGAGAVPRLKIDHPGLRSGSPPTPETPDHPLVFGCCRPRGYGGSANAAKLGSRSKLGRQRRDISAKMRPRHAPAPTSISRCCLMARVEYTIAANHPALMRR